MNFDEIIQLYFRFLLEQKRNKHNKNRNIFINFFVIFDNIAFFRNVLAVYPFSLKNIAFLTSLALGLSAFFVLILTLVTSKYTTKTVLILLFIITSLTAYFMDNYNAVIDKIMIQNVLETNWAEASELLNIEILCYFSILGVLPAIFVYRAKIISSSLKMKAICKSRDGAISVIILLLIFLFFSKFYFSFFREHKPLRYYTNPTYYVYSIGKYINQTFDVYEEKISSIGLEAKVVELDDDGDDAITELAILVVGEAARADHFSLNDYNRQTNPLLQKEDIITFSNVSSCGTSTSYSVPCIPKTQTHIAALMWFGKEISKDIDLEKIRRNKDEKYSHDNLFHTLLGIFEVETELYEKEMDILCN